MFQASRFILGRSGLQRAQGLLCGFSTSSPARACASSRNVHLLASSPRAIFGASHSLVEHKRAGVLLLRSFSQSTLANSNSSKDVGTASSATASKVKQQHELTLKAELDKIGGDSAVTENREQLLKPNFSARLSRGKGSSSGSDSGAGGAAKSGDLRRLFSLVGREKKTLALAITLLVVSSGLTLTMPWVIGKLLDAISSSSKDGEVPTVLGYSLGTFFAGLSGVFVVAAAAIYGRTLLLRSIGERVVSKLRVAIFRRIVSQDAEFFDANRVGDLISRLTTDANVVSRSVTQNIADGLRACLNVAMGAGMMCYLSLELTGYIVFILPPVIAGTMLYGRKVRSISRQFQKSLGSLTKVSEERLSNIKTAQSFVAETKEIGLYSNRVRDVFDVAMREARASGAFFSLLNLTGNVALVSLLGLGANMVAHGSMSFGELTSYIMYTAYAGSAASGVGMFYTELMKGSGAASRLFEILDRTPSIHPSKGDVLKNPRGDIEFRNVEFAYPTRPNMTIFHNLTCSVPSGSNVCIVGPSGGGKSTVASLLLRFYDPKKGSISIGGQDLRSLSAMAMRRHIGIVSQEPVLFSGTIAENIAYGVPHATREQIVDAAMRSNCTFVAKMPHGLDTAVGPRGAQLSGGQKQRIAIARALIKKPAILILDEATSALDVESESLVNAALNNLMADNKATTISIAHRLSTISRSDQVIVLGTGGTVIEQGAFKQLYADPNSALSALLQQRNELVNPAVDDIASEAERTHELAKESEEDLDDDLRKIESELAQQEEKELRSNVYK